MAFGCLVLALLMAGEVMLRLKYWRFWDGDASTTERYAVSLKIAPP